MTTDNRVQRDFTDIWTEFCPSLFLLVVIDLIVETIVQNLTLKLSVKNKQTAVWGMCQICVC
jgi:hypothetical protein